MSNWWCLFKNNGNNSINMIFDPKNKNSKIQNGSTFLVMIRICSNDEIYID